LPSKVYAHEEKTGRPIYHSAILLKLYIYGYSNRIQSNRRLERKSQRNLELIWLLERLTPDLKALPTSAKITAKPSVRFVANLPRSAANSIYQHIKPNKFTACVDLFVFLVTYRTNRHK
jgi:hypothetical protein